MKIFMDFMCFMVPRSVSRCTLPAAFIGTP